MALIDNIKNVYEGVDLLEKLQDPEYLESNGISAEEAEQFSKDVEGQIEKSKDKLEDLAGYIMRKREKHVVLSEGTDKEIKRLQDDKKFYDNQVSKAERTLEFILKSGKFEIIETPLGRIKLKDGDKMVVTDTSIDVLPENLTSLTASANSEIVEKNIEELKKLGFDIIKLKGSLTDIKKRYKSLDEEKQKELKGKGIYIDTTPKLQIK